MAELLKHKNEDINSQAFNDFFNVPDLRKYESIYLFSNFDYDNKEIQNTLKNELKNSKKITFISTKPNTYENNDIYYQELIKYFKKIGYNKFNLVDYRVSPFTAIQLLESADTILLMGGNPITQMAFIKEYELDSIINRFKGIIIGISAGAMNLAKTVYCSKDNDITETNTYEGIGLIDTIIDPHFDVNNSVQIQEFLNSKLEIIGLPDNTYIKVDKYGVNTIFGAYYIKESNKIRKVE